MVRFSCRFIGIDYSLVGSHEAKNYLNEQKWLMTIDDYPDLEVDLIFTKEDIYQMWSFEDQEMTWRCLEV